MSNLNIQIVNALPVTLVASTLYLVKAASSGHFEMVMTTKDGLTSRRVINAADVQSMVSSAVASVNTFQVVANIVARNAMSLSINTQVIVLDATGDTSVTSGSAGYVYKADTSTWHKLFETESMDIVLQWASIIGGPTSAPAAIDNAVSKAHTHTNAVVLDLLGEDVNGNLTYKGTAVGTVSSTTSEW